MKPDAEIPIILDYFATSAGPAEPRTAEAAAKIATARAGEMDENTAIILLAGTTPFPSAPIFCPHTQSPRSTPQTQENLLGALKASGAGAKRGTPGLVPQGPA
jgi:hypothetical protein